LNKSSLLLKINLQNAQTSQLFTKRIKTEIFTKVIKMSSLRACVKRRVGQIKTGWKCKYFKSDYLD